ncbi:RICIN domain-containing protein [Cryobacterium tagatosivorans]|uniref:Ricin B lectin domain-containing protein n=1 Tax=Cryobacterium tagatosivorans TaxID=1259199 RepID=A0A4R8UCM7_9MICO|nr:RICIN domain-containing protein [Cryobacterium tagatosivorans]TFB47231.1 hypothetical protein E3O23_15330 [Cryobacterium tagatosivorans]
MPETPLAGILSIRSMFTSIVSFSAVICLAVALAGGTYALLSSSASTASAATITSGTAALTVSPVAMSTTPLYPGLTTFGTATVTNAGDVPLFLRVTGLTSPTASTAFSQALTIGAGIAASPAACLAGSVTPTWTGTFAAATRAALGASVAAHGSAILCVSLGLPATAPVVSQGQAAANFGLLLDGFAAGSWTALTVGATASASSGAIGISQAGFAQLAVAYSPAQPAVTRAITVTNTGTIPAGYTLALGALSPTTLATTALVKTWPVASAGAADCGASTTPPVMPGWNWTTLPPLTGTLAASASAFYCVRTSLTAAQAAATDGRAMVATLALSSTVGSWSAAVSATVAQGVLDTTAPSVPAAPSASATTDAQTTIAWAPSTDVGGTKDYDVYRDGVLVQAATSSPYTDTGLSVGKAYSYTVLARDLPGNVSVASAPVTVTTLGLDSSKWYRVVNPAGGLCVAAPTTAVTVQLCTGGTNQAWKFAVSGSNYKSVSRSAPTSVWDTSLGGSGKGPVTLATDAGGATQQWQVVSLGTGSGTFHLLNAKSSDCLDTTTAAAGTQLQVKTCSAAASQTFTFTAVP